MGNWTCVSVVAWAGTASAMQCAELLDALRTLVSDIDHVLPQFDAASCVSARSKTDRGLSSSPFMQLKACDSMPRIDSGPAITVVCAADLGM